MAGTGLVVDRAGTHEQRRLECGVIDDMKHRCYSRRRCVPKPSSIVIMPSWLTVENARMAFKLSLNSAIQAADQHRREADRRNDQEPGLGAG